MAVQDLTSKISDHITNEVQAVIRFRGALGALLELHQDYVDNGYFEIITQDHIIGDNVHMTPVLVANVYSSIIAINTFMETNFHDDVLALASR